MSDEVYYCSGCGEVLGPGLHRGVVGLGTFHKQCAPGRVLIDKIARLTRERDEARAKVFQEASDLAASYDLSDYGDGALTARMVVDGIAECLRVLAAGERRDG